ncbi:hypothetical protein SPFM12_00013 [Salmonella phage SPFM12]|nr:hypothetical protein SPFM12_00013 [Salmonella phage SPFM12]
MVGANSNVPIRDDFLDLKPLYNSTHTHDLYRTAFTNPMNDIDELTIRLFQAVRQLTWNDISIPSMRISNDCEIQLLWKGEGRYYHRHRHQTRKYLLHIPKGDGIWIFNNIRRVIEYRCGDLQTFYSTLDDPKPADIKAWDDVEIRVDGRLLKGQKIGYVDFWVNGKMIAIEPYNPPNPQQIQIVLDRYNLRIYAGNDGGENAPVVKPTLIYMAIPQTERYKWLDDTPCYEDGTIIPSNSVYFWRTLSGQRWKKLTTCVNNFHAWMQVYKHAFVIDKLHLNYGNLSIPPEAIGFFKHGRNPIPLPGEGWWRPYLDGVLNIAPFRLTEKTGSKRPTMENWLVAHAVKNAWQISLNSPTTF